MTIPKDTINPQGAGVDNTAQPQPQPQPVPPPQHYQSMNVPSTIPGIQNVVNYLAIGPDGSMYAYDINLGQWGHATATHMERVIAASGIPPQVLHQIKSIIGR